jgi:hypothetical protein
MRWNGYSPLLGLDERPLGPADFFCGGVFLQPSVRRFSAWTFMVRDRELIVLEMSCQGVFRRRIFQISRSPSKSFQPYLEGVRSVSS